MSELEKPPTLTYKTLKHVKEIRECLNEGLTTEETIKKLGLSRNRFYTIMRHEQVQDIMIREVDEIESRVLTKLYQMLEDKNPVDRRHAITELNKLSRHRQDKVYPTLFATKTLNIHATIDPAREARDRQILTETINETLPPKLAERFTETLREKHRKYTDPPQ